MNGTEVHEMNGYRQGNTIVWNCPVCGWKATIINDGGFTRMIVSEEGNSAIEHRGNLALIVDAY